MTSAERKAICKRLSIEMGARKMHLEAALDDNEVAYRSAEMAQLFWDNYDLIRIALRGEGGKFPDIKIRSVRDTLS